MLFSKLCFVQAETIFEKQNVKKKKKITKVSAAVKQESPIQFTDSQCSEAKTSYPN